MPQMQKMFRAATLSLVTAATVSACAATRDVTALPDAANVAIGQRAYADGPLIQPVAVIEDSRCPVGVACVWAGRVRVKILLPPKVIQKEKGRSILWDGAALERSGFPGILIWQA